MFNKRDMGVSFLVGVGVTVMLLGILLHDEDGEIKTSPPEIISPNVVHGVNNSKGTYQITMMDDNNGVLSRYMMLPNGTLTYTEIELNFPIFEKTLGNLSEEN